MLELKKLSGRLNKDDPYENVEASDHVDARNIRFVNGQVQSVRGNVLVSFTMPAGTNISIGNVYDDFKQRIFFFNYNSAGTHGIYLYTLRTNTIQILAINGEDTNGNVFLFTAGSYFPDLKIIHGDDTQGDILYWLNSQGKPCKINIDRALGTLGTYGVIQSSYLDVHKEIPQRPPAVTFEDDATVTVNNFRKKLMKYRTRYVFDDKDKSAYSAHSKVPLPIGYTDTNADANADPSKNARVAIVVETGRPNVKKIEICACESLGNVFGDWFLIHVIDKVVDNIADDTLTTYRFYNDQAYTYVDLAESEEEFDWVPLSVNAQETLNGNVLAYAGILEGYNQITSNASVSSITEENLKTTQYPFVFVATQSANSGFGTGGILTKLIGAIPVGWKFHILTTNTDIKYTSIINDDAADVLVGLAAAAVVLGFTETHDGENVTVNKTGEALKLLQIEISANTKIIDLNQSVQWSLATKTFKLNGAAGDFARYSAVTKFVIDNSTFPEYFDGTYNIVSVTVNGADLDIVVSDNVLALSGGFNADITVYPGSVYGVLPVTDSYAYDWSSSYAFGVEYFDEKGITMGTITQAEMSAQTIPYNDSGTTLDVYLPKIGLSISQRPPLEARYYQILRTKNLTKSNFLHWISDHTYKDDEYAYISIEILNQYIIVNPQSSFLAWDFTPGDRIRFMKRLYAPGSVTYATTSKDFEIIASLTNPYVNGALLGGQILKIALPTTDDYFDFGGLSWDNYLIELYTPAKSVGNGLNVYYEFSERYMIGDAGLATRFHQGMLQNQSNNLATPATFEFTQGDNYFAQRTLNIGNVIKYSVNNNTNTDGNEWFLGMTKISSFNVQDYVVANQDFVATAGTIPAIEYFIKVMNGSFSFRITGQITVRVDAYTPVGAAIGTVRFLYSPFVVAVPGTNLGEQTGPFVAGQVLTFNIDQVVTRAAADNGTMSIVISNRQIAGSVNLDYTIVGGYITVTQLGQEYTVGIQNPNYSFFYESAVNSNGRPWVVNPDGRQSYNMALMRYGLAYQQDTNINQVNRFYESQLDEYDRSKGDVRRLKFRERILKVFQSSGVGRVGVYAQFITNANGATQLIYTSQIITANNIQYYAGEFGMGAQNTSLVSNKQVDYFIDPVSGEHIRSSIDGMTSVSKLYKGQYYLAGLLTPYNFEWDRPDGSKAKILGAYDYLDEQCVYVLQSGSRNNGEATVTIPAYAFSFNEKRNAYCSFYDFNGAESLTAGENLLYSFLNGQLYKHNSDTYCNFFGVQYQPSITLDFNGGSAAKKTFVSLAYQANGKWTATEITAQLDTYGTTKQSSKLVAANIKKLEGVYHASFLRDMNSRGGWINGATLKGAYLIIKFVGPADGAYYYINVISVESIPSPLNNT